MGLAGTALAVSLLALWAPSRTEAGYGEEAVGTSRCETDGFYYHDAESITICSNGNQYLQHCAYGTRNRDASHYGGDHYAYSDFCTVNLNDYGAGAARKGYHQPSYYQEEPAYHYYRQPTRHQSYGGYGHGGGYGGGHGGGHGHGGGGYGGGGYGGGHGGGGHGGGGYGGGGYEGGGHGGGGHGGGGYGHGGRKYATQYMSAHFPAFHKEPYH